MIRSIRRRNRKLVKKRRFRNPNIITTTQRILMTNIYTKHFYKLTKIK